MNQSVLRAMVKFCFLLLLVSNVARAQTLQDKLATATISNSFFQTDLNQAISDIALEADINIIVAAQTLFVTDAVFDNQPVLDALNLLLAGTGLVYDINDNYIIVYDPREVDQIDNRNIADFYRPRYLAPTEARALLPDDLQQFTNASDTAGLVNIYGPPPIVQSIKERFLGLDVNGLNTEIIVTRNIPPASIKAALPRNLTPYVTFDNDSKQVIIRGPKLLTNQIKSFITQMELNAFKTTIDTVPSSFEIYHPKAIAPAELLQLVPPVLRQYIQVTGASDLITIAADPPIVADIMTLLNAIDQPPKQVLLSAKIISLSDRDILDEGAELGMPKVRFGTSFFKDLTDTLFTPWAVGVGYSPSQEFSNALTVNLRMLEASEKATILSSPSVASLNNQEAKISFSSKVSQALETPASENGESTGTALKELTGGTTLTITPKIMGDGNIQLAIDVNVSDFDISGVTVGSIETSRSANTTVVVEDGGTAIIAGLSSSKKTNILTGLPGLTTMFTRSRQDDETVRLSILITAKILSTEESGLTTSPVIMRMDREAYANFMRQEMASAGMIAGDSK